MENNELEKKVQQWVDELSANNEIALRDELKLTLHQLRYLEKTLYCHYEPSLPPNINYWQRLTAWIGNLGSEKEQQLLFNLASQLFFVGRREIESMHRSAYGGAVKRWLIGLHKIPLSDANISVKLNLLIQSTWFCPITDSMKINEFSHINNIPTEISHRPDWQSLAKFGDSEKVREYIAEHDIKHIVLLEDFIATGTQSKKAIEFAANIRPANPIPVLVVPLILCPQAADAFAKMNLPAHVTIEPVLQLDAQHFISTDDAINSDSFNTIKTLAQNIHLQVSDGIAPAPKIKPYSPLGFKETGSLVVLYTNTPSNTIPLVHWKSAKWNPIFPRHSRV